MEDKFKTCEFGRDFFGDVGCSVPPGNLPLLIHFSLPEYCKLNLKNILYVGSILVWIFIDVYEFYFFSSQTDLDSNSS